MKVEKHLVETMALDGIRAIVNFQPPIEVTVNNKHADGPRRGQKNFALWRVHALACALLDTVVACRNSSTPRYRTSISTTCC